MAAEWSVVDATSTVEFKATQQGSTFTGRFEDFSAEIDFSPDMAAQGSIVGTVQTASVSTRDYDRDATLQDSDWFDVGNHPEARFESQSIETLDDGSYEAVGELTIKGTTKPATMAFTFEPAAGGDKAKFVGTMTIDRFEFNVGEGWNDTSWVGQNVDVEVSLDLTN